MQAKFPPRGYGPKGEERGQDRGWWDARALGDNWLYNPRKVFLGIGDGKAFGDPDAAHLPVGSGDDRHIVTIAGSRAGKSKSVLVPNLLHYPGSVVVIDPKGELVADTVEKRAQMGEVFVLDPFRIAPAVAKPFLSSFNPFNELSDSLPHTVAADAALLADGLIVPTGGDSHWTSSAKNLIRGIILHLHSSDPATASLRKLRRSLSSDTIELIKLLDAMVANSAYGGVVSNTGRGFKAKMERGEPTTEFRSILSTANEQTWPLDDVTDISDSSSFNLSSLTTVPMTIYLVIPATRLATHSKWLRLLINLTIAAIERRPVKNLKSGDLPVWVVLEEFAALGHMAAIETAAGFMAGMGCKLWIVLQDLTQLKTHYENAWETFLGNAGVIQAWSNVDATTTEYLSKLLGETTITEVRRDGHVSSDSTSKGDLGQREHPRTIPLLDPTEITYHFARERGRQIILSSGRPPIFLDRLGINEVLK